MDHRSLHRAILGIVVLLFVLGAVVALAEDRDLPPRVEKIVDTPSPRAVEAASELVTGALRMRQTKNGIEKIAGLDSKFNAFRTEIRRINSASKLARTRRPGVIRSASPSEKIRSATQLQENINERANRSTASGKPETTILG